MTLGLWLDGRFSSCTYLALGLNESNARHQRSVIGARMAIVRLDNADCTGRLVYNVDRGCLRSDILMALISRRTPKTVGILLEPSSSPTPSLPRSAMMGIEVGLVH